MPINGTSFVSENICATVQSDVSQLTTQVQYIWTEINSLKMYVYNYNVVGN